MEINKLKKILDSFKNKKIVIIGDLMLDHYIWGNVDRISPEAPVPVLAIRNEEYRLGGAANVVNNIKALGAEPIVFGVAGNDEKATILKTLLEENGISSNYIFLENSRVTTIKSRIIAHKQQVVRIDNENTNDVTVEIENLILNGFKNVIEDADAVILEDYNKGLLTKNLIRELIRISNEKNKPVTVDPKFKNFFEYENVTVFKPNLLELQKNLGIEISNDEELKKAATKLHNRINAENVIITRGEKGLSIFNESSSMTTIPTFAQDVYDVSGAGDTVIGVLTLALATGCSVYNSALIANHAAGIVCGKLGINTVDYKEILESFEIYKEENDAI